MTRGVIGALALALSGCMSFYQGPLPGEPEDARFLELGDTRVRYMDEGSGPAVLMLHGFAASLNTWDPVAPELVGSHRVIRIDLKGFGWTDRPPGDYSPSAQADIAVRVLDKLGVEQAAVVAHSWGSSVALALALEHPDRVTRLALYDAWAYHEQLPTFFVWARAHGLGEALFWLFYEERAEDRMSLAFYDQRYVTQELIEAVEETLERPGTVAAALAAARGQRYEEVQDRYRTIDKPVLLLWGEEDRVAPLWVGQRLARALPDARLISYGACGHFPMIEARSASNRALVAFLAEGR